MENHEVALKIIALIKKGVESFPDASVSGGNGPSK